MSKVASDEREVRTNFPSDSKKRARAPDADVPAWRLEPHVCRHCFGRLVSAPAAGGGRWFECTNCGTHADGASPAVLCACGLMMKNPTGGLPIAVGLRCQPNPNPTPEFPSLFVASPAAT